MKSYGVRAANGAVANGTLAVLNCRSITFHEGENRGPTSCMSVHPARSDRCSDPLRASGFVGATMATKGERKSRRMATSPESPEAESDRWSTESTAQSTSPRESVPTTDSRASEGLGTMWGTQDESCAMNAPTALETTGYALGLCSSPAT